MLPIEIRVTFVPPKTYRADATYRVYSKVRQMAFEADTPQKAVERALAAFRGYPGRPYAAVIKATGATLCGRIRPPRAKRGILSPVIRDMWRGV